MIVVAGQRCVLTRRCVYACVYAGLVLLAPAASGDVDVWGSIGPTGANVFALAIDPHAPATIYAGTGGGAQRFNSTAGGGVFKTTNGGASWQPAGGWPGAAVLSLAIDPVTSSTVYAGTRNRGIWKSTDGGASWTAPAAILAATARALTVCCGKPPVTLFRVAAPSGFSRPARRWRRHRPWWA